MKTNNTSMNNSNALIGELEQENTMTNTQLAAL